MSALSYAYVGNGGHSIDPDTVPLYNLSYLTEVDPKRIETVNLIRHRPNYSLFLSTHIEPDKESALMVANERFCSAQVSVLCDGSGFEDGVGASAILHTDMKETSSLITTWAQQWDTVYEGDIVVVGSDSQTMIEALLNQCPHPAHYLLDQAHFIVELFHIKQDHRAGQRHAACWKGLGDISPPFFFH
ncbi:hypothetical protein H2248_012044 [Termitomyces sp. 'cryptogamus']|nr:hypothetical protein H2248_012044 [Termitomyces sp. 'cryptogamus']